MNSSLSDVSVAGPNDARLIVEGLAQVRRDLQQAAEHAKRDLATINLIAVSKTHEQAAVLTALGAGQLHFGENRVQEAKAKFSGLKTNAGVTTLVSEYLTSLQLHLIGPLQTNKAEDAVRLFDVIHTLDRPKLAQALAAAMTKIGRNPHCYIEVNIGAEPQKAGIAPADLGGFLDDCRGLGLVIEGLMCIPPQGDQPEVYFRKMQELAATHKLARLSMGMSADFTAAIACGATDIRVGTAIFGKR